MKNSFIIMMCIICASIARSHIQVQEEVEVCCLYSKSAIERLERNKGKVYI